MADESFNEYNWSKPKTHAHNYLLKDLIKCLNDRNIFKESQILDAGCGGGYILGELYKRNFKNLWGFDSSKSGIEVTKKNFPALENRVEVHDAYIRELPESFPPRNYDLILSVEVIEHLYSPRVYLDNINQWLNSDGYFILTTPYHGYLKNLAITLLNKFDRHFDPISEGGHIKFFSKKTLFPMLRQTGLEPVKFLGSGRFPYMWKSMVIVAQKI